MNDVQKTLTSEQRENLLQVLRIRFENNMARHSGLTWGYILAKLEARDEKLWPISEMERTGGEPDVVWYDRNADTFIFIDCSAESPAGRRSLCDDREALESRKTNKPENSAVGMAAGMGIELLTEDRYRQLQKLGPFDTKTSSWLKTPDAVRTLGGAIFGDFRYGQVFVYHNGADSYYSARGFRGCLRI
jgi:hypothetical protein